MLCITTGEESCNETGFGPLPSQAGAGYLRAGADPQRPQRRRERRADARSRAAAVVERTYDVWSPQVKFTVQNSM